MNYAQPLYKFYAIRTMRRIKQGIYCINDSPAIFFCNDELVSNLGNRVQTFERHKVENKVCICIVR